MQDSGSGSGEGIFNKLKGGMDKARMMGQKVVPRFGPDRERMAQASSICMHRTHHGLYAASQCVVCLTP